MDQDQFNQALQRNLDDRKRLERESIKKLYSRKALEQGFLECFELIGGVPRLAIWANEPGNYTEFLKLLVKFAPKALDNDGESGRVINFVSSIPDSPLNNPQPDTMAISHGEDAVDGELA